MISCATFAEALKHVGRTPNTGQRQAVEAAKSESLFVVAGPGTGKTACLTMRILKLVFVDGVPPSGVLATTFTKKAAAELRSRILAWGFGIHEKLLKDGKLSEAQRMWLEQRVDINQIRTGTIDSICEELLRDFRDPGTDPPILADEFVSQTLLLRSGMFAGGKRRDQDENLDAFLCEARGTGRFGWHVGTKTDLVRTMWDRRHHDQIAWKRFLATGRDRSERKARRVLSEAMGDYGSELRSRGMADFAQLEQTVLDRLRGGGFREFCDQLEVVLVDEYQDTNLLQESLYFELAKRCGGALTVVGDDDQSLYRFRGATVDLFRDFEGRYKTIGGFKKRPRKVFLNANYRSTKTIVGFVNGYSGLDAGYQSVRVTGKPPLVSPGGISGDGVPVLGMFRTTLDDLAEDLAGFIHSVARGRGFKVGSHRIQVDRSKGGDVGDIALLCSSPRERNFSGDPRLPLALREALLNQPKPIETFNPRGEDFAGVEIVQLLGGLVLCCLDRDGDAEDAAGKGLGRDTRQSLQQWASLAEDWLAGRAKLSTVKTRPDRRLVRFVDCWAKRDPGRPGWAWPKYVSCIELLYALVHWLPELHDDPEGQIYFEVFTRQLGAAEQVSGFRAQVITDRADPKLSLSSVGHLLLYFLGPIADGSAKVDEELMDAFPRDRLNILSIHQSKGLEFPLVIVDVGSDFRRDHPAHAFKRFPRRPGTPQNLEDLMRPHSPLRALSRSGVDRAFDDLYRQFFVAFSRPEEVLLLVGLDGVRPGKGDIPNVATGWDRDCTNHWASKPPLVFI